MGFISFLTSDTKESIPNKHTSRGTFTVALKDNRGRVWVESQYDGYGVFGGKDYYELIAEMNAAHPAINDSTNTLEDRWGNDALRVAGLRLAHLDEQEGILYPVLCRLERNGYWSTAYEWRENAKPSSCPHQGYFYDDFTAHLAH